MQSVTPQLEGPTARVAEHQKEYIPVTVCALRHPAYPVPKDAGYNSVVMAFRPDELQRKAIADGADIYVSLLTFGQPQQGIIVMAGKEEASAIYNIKATD